MFTRRFRRHLMIGILGLAGAFPAPAQSLTAPRGAAQVRNRPPVRRLTADEVWHRLNTAAGDAVLYAREIERGRLLILRGLTNDFTQPYTGNMRELSKQQMRWLAGGASILTEKTAPPERKTATLPEGTQTEQNFNAFVREFLESGMTADEFMDYLRAKYALPEEPPPGGGENVWDMIRNWQSSRDELARLGDAAQTEALKAYTDYFDGHWSELSESEKCCIDKRLEAVRPGLTYNEFKNRLKFPQSYPRDGLTPKERGKLVASLAECLPMLAKTELLPAQQLAKAFANAAEAAGKFLRDSSFKILDKVSGVGFAMKTAKNFVIDWATGGGEDNGGLLYFDYDGPGGPNDQGARFAPSAPPARSSSADVAALLMPRQAGLPLTWAALRIEGGRAIIPDPYAGTYDIYLFRPQMTPGVIRAVPTDSVRPRTLRVATPRNLSASSNAPFRATVNPAPDKPPEPPAVPPVQGCPCKPYRIVVTSNMTCRPAGSPLRYSSVVFRGQAQFDVFENDYQFPAGTSTRYLKPIVVPMRSQRQFWNGQMDGAAFSYAPASLDLRGDLSVKIALNKPPRGQTSPICLNLDVDYLRNPEVAVRQSIRDIGTGQVTSGTSQEAMFSSLASPIGMQTKYGCGFPGRVVIRADSSKMPAELLVGCTWVEQVVIEPLDEADPLSLDPATPPQPPQPPVQPPTPPVQPPTTTDPAATPGGGATLRKPGTNRPGGDYRDFEMPRADPAACQAACARESQCKSWTYVKPGVQGDKAHCWLKDAVMDPYSDECCVSGAKGTQPAAPAAEAALEVNSRRDGADFRRIEMTTTYPNACKSACEGEAQCKSWTFVKPEAPGGAGVCWLKSAVPPRTADPRAFSGVKAAAAVAAPAWKANTNRFGGDYRSLNLAPADPGACQSACGRDPRCRSWTLVKPLLPGGPGVCWLKSAVPPESPDDCCVSGVKK